MANPKIFKEIEITTEFERLEDGIKSAQTQLEHHSREIKELKSAFPNGDTRRHHDYHEGKIEQAQDSKDIQKSVKANVYSRAAWVAFVIVLFLIFSILSYVQYIKIKTPVIEYEPPKQQMPAGNYNSWQHPMTP